MTFHQLMGWNYLTSGYEGTAGASSLLKTSDIHHQAPTFCPITGYMESVVTPGFYLLSKRRPVP